MLDAVPGEDDAPPVVHPHRDAEDDRALGVAEALGDPLGDVRDRQRLVELGDRHPVERRVPLELGVRKLVGNARHRRAESTPPLPDRSPEPLADIRGAASKGSPRTAPPPTGRVAGPRPLRRLAAHRDRGCARGRGLHGPRPRRARPAEDAIRRPRPCESRGGTRTRTPHEGTPAFKAGASHPFRHPGRASVRPRGPGLGAPRLEQVERRALGAATAIRVDERVDRALVQLGALREDSRPFVVASGAVGDPGAERDRGAERRDAARPRARGDRGRRSRGAAPRCRRAPSGRTARRCPRARARGGCGRARRARRRSRRPPA